MDAASLATTAGLAVSVMLALIAMHRDLVGRVFPREVTKLVNAQKQSDKKAGKRHAEHLRGMRSLLKVQTELAAILRQVEKMKEQSEEFPKPSRNGRKA